MEKRNQILQVKDDPQLLELMIQDSLCVEDSYKISNYWSFFENQIVEELKKQGLKDFRRRKNSALANFGATDYHYFFSPMDNSLKGSLLKLCRFNFKMIAKIKMILRLVGTNQNNSHNLNFYLYELAKRYGQKCGAKPIEQFEIALAGNPENTFVVNEKLYTINLLYYYVMYSYCCQFMDFNKINSMLEIGCGSGKQIEVIKKLYPHITFYALDLSPQLYVCGQYLSSIFPDSIVSYKETRDMTRIPDNKKGKIFILGNWNLSKLENLEYDLFWNSASLQEMEPHIVANYLKYVNQQTTKFIFLHETMVGQTVAKFKGDIGVLKKTVLEDYKRGLNNFILHDLSVANHLPTLSRFTSYRFSFWKRR